MNLTLTIILILNAMSMFFNVYCGLRFIIAGKARQKELESVKKSYQNTEKSFVAAIEVLQKHQPEDMTKSYTHSRPAPKGECPNKRLEINDDIIIKKPEYRKDYDL